MEVFTASQPRRSEESHSQKPLKTARYEASGANMFFLADIMGEAER